MLAWKESREQGAGGGKLEQQQGRSSSRSREASMINATTSPTDSSDRRTQGHRDRGERWKGRGREGRTRRQRDTLTVRWKCGGAAAGNGV